MTCSDSKDGKGKVLVFVSVIVALGTAGILFVYSTVIRRASALGSRAASREFSEEQAPSDKKQLEDIQSQTLPPL